MSHSRFVTAIIASGLACAGVLTAATPSQAATLADCDNYELSRYPSNPKFQLVHWNIEGMYGLSTTEINKRVERLKRVSSDSTIDRASIYGLTEVNNAVNGHSVSDAQIIAGKLGSSYTYWPRASTTNRKTQAIIWDTNVWSLQDTGIYTFTSGNDWVHGFAHVRLKSLSTGRQVNVIEYHLEEGANAEGTESQKQAIRDKQWTQLTNTFASWSNPVAVVGDSNWRYWNGSSYVSNTVSAGSSSRSKFEALTASQGLCTPRVSSTNQYHHDYGTTGNYAAGGTAYDFGALQGSFAMRSYSLLNGTSAAYNSDHHLVTLDLTSGGPL